MWSAEFSGFRRVVQSGNETIGETTARENVFAKPVKARAKVFVNAAAANRLASLRSIN
jgi:hypothetical protein